MLELTKSGGTISQQAAVHLWLAADAHVQQQQQQQQQAMYETDSLNVLLSTEL
jgi:hypothetical protein